MSRLWSLARSYGIEVLIVVAALESTLELAVGHDSPRAPRTTLAFVIPAVLVLLFLLFGRRRFPFAVPAVFWVLGAALSFVDGRLIVFPVGLFLAGMGAALLLGSNPDGRRARIGLIIVLGCAEIVVSNDPARTPSELVFTPLLFAIAWLAGFALRERADQAEAAELRASEAERERDLASRIAVAEERARMARELHDVVAHAVSVMVLQVGAVRHRLPPELDRDKNALSDVEKAGRTALSEMRHLLNVMRRESDDLELRPQPGLAGLEALIDEVRHAGLPVQLQVEGQPVPLPRSLDLSAYRIVQEGLTNALKHAHANRADVMVTYRPTELQVEVRDDGRAQPVGDGLGHGLVGIRERVKIYGGEMTAGAAPGGGFLLQTRLPLNGDRS